MLVHSAMQMPGWRSEQEEGTSLTFVFLEACRPSRKAGTGSFCILWEIMHLSVENEKMKIC